MKRLAAGDGAAEGEFVGVFEVVAEAEASGKGGDLNVVSGNLAVDVERGRLAFDIAAQGEDEFEGAGGIFRDPLHKFADCQVGRADAVDG